MPVVSNYIAMRLNELVHSRTLLINPLGTKFDVTYDSIELMKSGKVTELPGHVPDYAYYPKEQVQAIVAGFQLLFEEGHLDFKPKQTLNDLFPDIRAVTAKEMFEMGWKA